MCYRGGEKNVVAEPTLVGVGRTCAAHQHVAAFVANEDVAVLHAVQRVGLGAASNEIRVAISDAGKPPAPMKARLSMRLHRVGRVSQ